MKSFSMLFKNNLFFGNLKKCASFVRVSDVLDLLPKFKVKLNKFFPYSHFQLVKLDF